MSLTILVILIWQRMSMTIIVIVTKNVSDNSSILVSSVQIYFHIVFLVYDNSCHFDKTMSMTFLVIWWTVSRIFFTESFFDCLFQLEFYKINNIIRIIQRIVVFANKIDNSICHNCIQIQICQVHIKFGGMA